MILFNRLIPELNVADLEVSKNFYLHKLGFTTDFERLEDKFLQIAYQGSQIMLVQEEDWITAELVYPRGRGINLQIETNDLTEIEQRIAKFNLSYFREPRENWYRIEQHEEGVKELLIQDPDGYLLRFQQYLGIRSLK